MLQFRTFFVRLYHLPIKHQNHITLVVSCSGGKAARSTERSIIQLLARPSQMSHRLTALAGLLSPNRAHQGFSGTRLHNWAVCNQLSLWQPHHSVGPNYTESTSGSDSSFPSPDRARLRLQPVSFPPHLAGFPARPRSRLTQAKGMALQLAPHRFSPTSCHPPNLLVSENQSFEIHLI